MSKATAKHRDRSLRESKANELCGARLVGPPLHDPSNQSFLLIGLSGTGQHSTR